MLMSDVISNNAAVSDYLSNLNNARATRISLSNRINSDIETVQSMMESRSNLLELFTTDAMMKFPWLINQNIFEVMPKIPSSDPLHALWATYRNDIMAYGGHIVRLMNRLNSENDALFVAEQMETNILSSYDKFQKNANTEVPTIGELQARLDPVPVVPVDTTSLLASIPAIELLSPDAAAMVTTQIVDIQMQNSTDIALRDGVSPTGVEVTGALPAPVQPSGFNLWGLVLLAGGFAYALMG